MFINRIAYISILFGLFMFYVYCDSYMPLFIIYIIVLVTVVNAVTAFLSSKKVTVSLQTLSSSVSVKLRELAFCSEIKNSSVLAVPLIQYEMTFRDKSEDSSIIRKVRTSSASLEEKQVCLNIVAPYASFIEGRIKKARVYDAFGVFSFPVKINDENVEMLITPSFSGKPVDLLVHSSVDCDSDIYSATQKGDDRSQVFEVRGYRDGDDIRRIHWGLSSKLGELIVKEYSKPIENRSAVLLESSVCFEESPNKTIEELIERKSAIDRILGQFTTLAMSLLDNEEVFVTEFYSQKSGDLVVFDVAKYEDISLVLKAILSEPLPCGNALSLDKFISQNNSDSSVYYIYDSSVCKNSDIPRDIIYPIDTAEQVKIFDEE